MGYIWGLFLLKTAFSVQTVGGGPIDAGEQEASSGIAG